eukprot:4186944-Lingulodinium_polyedra.AAC.1
MLTPAAKESPAPRAVRHMTHPCRACSCRTRDLARSISTHASCTAESGCMGQGPPFAPDVQRD